MVVFPKFKPCCGIGIPRDCFVGRYPISECCTTILPKEDFAIVGRVNTRIFHCFEANYVRRNFYNYVFHDLVFLL